MTFAYITNNCGNLSFYFDEQRKYDHPFIGCLIVNDDHFLKLCENFEFYLKQPVIFGQPNANSIWARQNGSPWYQHEEITPPYPVMYLADIEIHWIHEKTEEELREKFKRRTRRYFEQNPTPLFLWSDGDLMNNHELNSLEYMIQKFNSIPNTIYVTKYPKLSRNKGIWLMKEWIGHEEGRNSSHIPNIHTVGDRVEEYKKIIKLRDTKPPDCIFHNISPCESSFRNFQLGYYNDNKEVVNFQGDYTASIHEKGITILRHDEDVGWGYMGMIFPETEDYLEIGSCTESRLVKNIEFPVPTRKIQVQDTKIPKVIIQTAEEAECYNKYTTNSMLSIVSLNPEYEYKFFNSVERRKFIQQFDEKVIKAYDLLVAGAYQADLFRYCYLYLYGGCYLDLKMIQRVPLREIISPEDTFCVCIDYERSNSLDRNIGTSYLNSLIFTYPRNPLLMDAINKCVDNILNYQGKFLGDAIQGNYQTILDITGPTMLYKCWKGKIDQSCLKYKHIIQGNDETDYRNFQIVDIDTGKLLFTKTHKTYDTSNHYSLLWTKKEIFYRNYVSLGDLDVYVYPHPFEDHFIFYLVNEDTLRIKRTANEGWWLDLKLKIVDRISGEAVIVNVGKHHTGVKDICIKGFFQERTELPKNVFKASKVQSEQINVGKIVIGMPSVIRVSANPMIDRTTRSLFSTEERMKQTLIQIESVRKKIPDATIILLEASVMKKKEIQKFSEVCDYIFLYDDEDTYEYCHNNTANKGLGEMHVLSHLTSVLETKTFDYFIKFGARYYLMEQFNIDRFLLDVPVIHAIAGSGKLQTSRGVINSLAYCLFYCFPKKYMAFYREHYKLWLHPDTTEPVEHVFTMFLQALKRVEIVDKLWIEGYAATTGELVSL